MNEKEFKSRIDRELQQLVDACNAFPWDNKNAYAEWLGQAQFFVRHATRLLALAASRFPQEKTSYHNRFLDHLREERGHDVMLGRDLKGLGRDLSEFKEMPETSALYQVQYYWIEHINPMAFFGYILCLEGMAVRSGSVIYQKIKNKFGEQAGLFLKVHAAEDEDHYAKALDQLSKISPEEMKAVMENMALSRGLYSNIFEAIQRAHAPALKRAG